MADTFSGQSPKNQRGEEMSPEYAGHSYYRIATAAEHWVSSKTVVLAGVVMSTGATTAWIVFRDTDTANGSGDRVIGRIGFNTAPATLATQPIIPVSIRFKKGMTVELISTAAGEEATVLYQELR